MELKSALALREGLAGWPDAPTARGLRQIRALARALGEGYKTFLSFVVAHPEAAGFRPLLEVQPEIGAELEGALRAGVEMHAVKLWLSGEGEIFFETADLPLKLSI